MNPQIFAVQLQTAKILKRITDLMLEGRGLCKIHLSAEKSGMLDEEENEEPSKFEKWLDDIRKLPDKTYRIDRS
jgi:hypothetical protein